MHSFELCVLDFLDIDECVFTPESDFADFVGQGVDTEIDLLPWGSMVDLELEVVNGDSSIRINGSIHSETEDIFTRLKRGSDFEFSKERLFLM